MTPVAGRLWHAVQALSGAGLFARRDERVLSALLWSNLFTAGVLTYFSGLDQYRQLLYLVLPAALAWQTLQRVKAREVAAGLRPLALALIIILFLSWRSLSNDVASMAVVLSAAKPMFYIAVLFCLLRMVAQKPAALASLQQHLYWLLMLQLPFCLYQFLIVAPQRGGNYAGDIAWDAVVGTMGGDPLGGGNSPTLGLLAVAGLALTIADRPRWRSQFRLQLLRLIACVLPIVLAEVKFALLLLPIAIFLGVFGSQGSLRKAAVTAVFSLIIPVLIFLFYSEFIYAKYAYGSIATAAEKQFAELTEGEMYNRDTGELGRIHAIHFWWDQDGRWWQKETFIGEGLGAVRYQTASGGIFTPAGIAAARFPYLRPAPSSLVTWLWELGLIGAGAISLLLLAAAARAAWYLRTQADEQQRTLLVLAAALSLFTLLSILYTSALNDTVQAAWLLALSLFLISRHRAGKVAS